MDYDIYIDVLNNVLSNFESSKSAIEESANSAIDSILKYSSCESSRIVTAANNIKTNLEKLINGSENIQKWLNDYITELEALENRLASFQGTIAPAPFEFQGTFSNMFAKATVPVLKTGVSGEDLFIDVSTPNYEEGYKFWQVQGNSVNCGATAFTVAVNTLLGKAEYNNVDVWNQMGSYSEAIGEGGSTQAQNWINSQGLQDEIEVIGVDNINTPEKLIEVLENGGIAVVSAGGQVFKHNDGSKASYSGHYIEFYATENGSCYANDSASRNQANQAGVEYTYEDLQQFFANYHNSVAIKAK